MDHPRGPTFGIQTNRETGDCYAFNMYFGVLCYDIAVKSNNMCTFK